MNKTAIASLALILVIALGTFAGIVSAKSIALAPEYKELEVSEEAHITNVIESVQIKRAPWASGTGYSQIRPSAVIKEVEGSVSETTVLPDYTQIEISPEEQTSETGKATYKIIVTDKHPVMTCVDCQQEEYKYELKFESEHDIEGIFDQDSFLLESGESTTILLEVESDQEGTNIFVVSLEGEETYDAVKGLLIFGEETERDFPGSTSYFGGTGFLINEDKTQGFLTSIHLLRDKKDSVEPTTLEGKMKIGQTNFILEGTLMDQQIELEIYTLKKEYVGKFTGEIKKFERFLLLEATMNFEDETWDLSVISHKRRIFRPSIELSEHGPVEIEDVKINEIATVSKKKLIRSGESETEEVYFRPKEIKRKLFGITNPYWGKKYIEVEVVEGDKIETIKIEEFSKEQVGELEIEVGSLQDEEAIEFTIESTA